jgi:BirA family transcriptional regulator, biotin operon repressor / biotin---[acetyl-CoA-carboxylase] ligase
MNHPTWNALVKTRLPSTQAYLKDHWQTLPDHSYVVAEEQTAGQGREQRPWFSEPGGLYFSILLKPETIIAYLPWRVWLCNLQVLEAFSNRHLQLKAPNDILYQGRKLSGTLIDGSIQGTEINYYILGVGINVSNTLPEGLAACHLESLLGSVPDKNELLNYWLTTFNHALSLSPEKWLNKIRDPYMQRSVQMGYHDPYWINLEEYWNAQ